MGLWLLDWSEDRGYSQVMPRYALIGGPALLLLCSIVSAAATLQAPRSVPDVPALAIAPSQIPGLAGAIPSPEATPLEPLSVRTLSAVYQGLVVAPPEKGADRSPAAEMLRLRRLDASLSGGEEPVESILDRLFDDETTGTSPAQAAFMIAALSAGARLRRAPHLLLLDERAPITAAMSGQHVLIAHPALLRELPRNRIAVIVAHELGHAKNRELRLARDLLVLPIAAMLGGLAASLTFAAGHPTLAFAAGAALAVASMASGIRRHAFRHLGEEFRADGMAARLSGDAGLVRQTLREIVEPGLELERRVERLERLTLRRRRL